MKAVYLLYALMDLFCEISLSVLKLIIDVQIVGISLVA